MAYHLNYNNGGIEFGGFLKLPNKFHANFSFYTANNFNYFSCCVYNYNLSNLNMTGGTIKIHIVLVYHVFKNSCSTKFFEKLKNKT